VTSQANGLFNYLMLEHGAARESKREREAVGGQELSLSASAAAATRPPLRLGQSINGSPI